MLTRTSIRGSSTSSLSSASPGRGTVTAALLASALLAACSGGGGESRQLTSTAESCMTCHNGSPHDDYAGPGMENPHPFAPADDLLCTACHGGNPDGQGVADSHVPPPPEIGDDAYQLANRTAWFNRLTLTGLDKYPDYTVGGRTYTALEYLQFVNPGDLRVVTRGESCGQCHTGHAECVETSLLATSAGIFSGAMYAIGAENEVPESVDRYADTAADRGFRAVTDSDFVEAGAATGAVARLLEVPVFSARNATGPDQMFNNDAYDATTLPTDLTADNRVVTGSHLANLFTEQVSFTCGDCHLGSAGANDRYGDFRSSGCTACHMPYSLDGRSRAGDPNVNRLEPADPDDIDPPERSHPERHLIRSVARTLPGGEQVQGISDYACAGCHQGSNRTVMQYWGIRLDQNQDLRRGKQYPAMPASYRDTTGDTRLFDPAVGNNTFNGRNRRQYILEEDYDGDGRDDTPPDVHYEAGLGCIDCHGSVDLHGGDVTDPHGGAILSRMEQGVAIECESCHGGTETYAQTVMASDYAGNPAEVAVDGRGLPLRHVVKETDGHVYLYSRLTGQRHFVVQTKDTIVDSGKTNPLNGDPIYSDLASYAMGRDDDSGATGIGPQQTGLGAHGFSHSDTMSCVSCHAAWTNNCIGCHLGGEYDNGNNFSNITGERIVFKQANADFTYQSPVFFQLGIGADNRIEPMAPNTETFWQYEDRQGRRSDVFAFTDRNGGGNNPDRATHPALAHNVMMPHSIRGRVTPENEGPRYCVSCHLTNTGLATYGVEYDTLRAAMQNPAFPGLDVGFFDVLKEHIGQNTGNAMNSPLWVHMAAGLGSGLFLFDENGCPVNPLDDDDQRVGCDRPVPESPQDRFTNPAAQARYNLDRMVDESGASLGSSTHANTGAGPNRRDGSVDPELSGPLGATLLQRLTDPDFGIVLNAWIDADGVLRGDAPILIGP